MIRSLPLQQPIESTRTDSIDYKQMSREDIDDDDEHDDMPSTNDAKCAVCMFLHQIRTVYLCKCINCRYLLIKRRNTVIELAQLLLIVSIASNRRWNIRRSNRKLCWVNCRRWPLRPAMHRWWVDCSNHLCNESKRLYLVKIWSFIMIF
jgi:hypothetical protein